jgi:hypothetical protein
MNRPLSWVCFGTLLSVATLPAQGLGGMPMMAPVAGSIGSLSPTATAAPSMPADCMPPSQPRDPATEGPQLAGKELARSIARVTALSWFDDLDEARLESAATGKPILWLQALGDIDGFA